MMKLWHRLRNEKSGAVAIQIAIMLVVIIGFVALGTEITYLLFKQRQMQATADTSALGGALALGMGYPADYTVEARAIAGNVGFVSGTGGVTVTVANPPLSGSHAGDTSAVEVTIDQPQQMQLLKLFGSGLFDVHARAVALEGVGGGLYCLLALDPTASGALHINNNGVVANPHCGVSVDSSSNTALTLSNNAAINGPVSVPGHWSLLNNATMTGTPRTQNAPIVADPYAI